MVIEPVAGNHPHPCHSSFAAAGAPVHDAVGRVLIGRRTEGSRGHDLEAVLEAVVGMVSVPC